MISLNQQKLITSLHIKKYRQKYRKFIVEGEKMAAEALSQKRMSIESIFASEKWLTENSHLLHAFTHQITGVTESEMRKITALTTPSQILIVANMADEPLDLPSMSAHFTFYLDGLQDPGNMGTILRTADWFGFSHVICSPETVDGFSPKVVQASMGACFRVRMQEVSLDVLLAQMPENTPVIGAVMDGENLFSAQSKPTHGLIVIGNEGRGISSEVEKRLSHRYTIPKAANSRAESLNAGVAASIFAALLSV